MNYLYDIDFIPRKQVMLSTKDNPYNPFTHYDEWFQYDFEHQHHCCEILARMAHVSDDLSEDENREECEAAMDRIIAVDPEKKFIKVYKD